MSSEEKLDLRKSHADAQLAESQPADMPYFDAFDEERVDRVASSHGDGEHYAEIVSK